MTCHDATSFPQQNLNRHIFWGVTRIGQRLVFLGNLNDVWDVLFFNCIETLFFDVFFLFCISWTAQNLKLESTDSLFESYKHFAIVHNWHFAIQNQNSYSMKSSRL